MNGHRPFRFGVMGNASPEAWVEHVRQAEDLGYNTLSLGEHIFASLAPLSALTAAAMCISTIRLGSLTFANDFRNPVLLAKEVATLDALSGGRFEFGLGSGFARADYSQTGIPFDPPGIRLDRFFDAVRLIKASFDNDPVDYAGSHYTVTGLSLTPTLPRRPPILIGGGGRRGHHRR
jgi:probable F420-dependent oxidoreductase